MFYAISGCDTTSSFARKGSYPSGKHGKLYTSIHTAFSIQPPSITEEQHRGSQRFIVLLYERTSITNSVTDLRQPKFSRNPGSPESIPPTSAVLKQHILCASY